MPIASDSSSRCARWCELNQNRLSKPCSRLHFISLSCTSCVLFYAMLLFAVAAGHALERRETTGTRHYIQSGDTCGYETYQEVSAAFKLKFCGVDICFVLVFLFVVQHCCCRSSTIPSCRQQSASSAKPTRSRAKSRCR